MRVTFTYHPLVQSTPTTALALALGERLSPVGPVQFSHSGQVQASRPVRAETATFFGRGGASTTESFVAQKEHVDHWAAMVWSRVTLGAARGKAGTLLYEGDNGGRIKLVECVLVSAEGAPGLVGITSFIRFTFVGGLWQPG